MKQTKADILTEKLQFNSYDDFKTHPTADLKCPTCNETVSIAFKDLEKHQYSDFSNLTDSEQKSINEFVDLNLKEVPNSFLDFNCPNCKTSIRLYYESWAGGQHGEYGYDLKAIISE